MRLLKRRKNMSEEIIVEQEKVKESTTSSNLSVCQYCGDYIKRSHHCSGKKAYKQGYNEGFAAGTRADMEDE